ncbi:UV-endonuclease UVE-1 [Xylogone sp. PMI_703]|nr:UV-endonuclease UVE-1 [Xylogone sp. PMI_703]
MGKTAVPRAKSMEQRDGAKPLDTAAQTARASRSSTRKRAAEEEEEYEDTLFEELTPDLVSGKKKKRLAVKKSRPTKEEVHRTEAAKADPEIMIEGEGQDKSEMDIEAEPDVADDLAAVKRDAARPPPVNSAYLPLPWKGRLGYACLNTYLRTSNPPVFNSRTCRIASILAHRHPLRDETQPEHPTRNPLDRTAPPDVERGRRYVEQLGLENVRDVPRILRWNDKYGIQFFRLSSEMFPFASHEEYGYKLAPFAAGALAEVGKVAAELGHRLTMHPGQYTQLGSPREAVVRNAVRDLEYHDELLNLLKLPEQQDRDAVMIIHLGGTFGDKVATIERFKANYLGLSDSIKKRLVLENDDVSWSVHDLLPICEELNIPLVLDFHHHNIVFDASQVREGSHDIVALFPRIKVTWDRKRIRQKMHYSEPRPEAITARQRRQHNARPSSLPPCPNDMDLMIEAKDKEQAVFELMRTLKLPGWDRFADIIPYERADDNRNVPKKGSGAEKRGAKKDGSIVSLGEGRKEDKIAEDEFGMGGRENRVFWPIGMEEWLSPKKREVKRNKG